jgi:hypothetical protein
MRIVIIMVVAGLLGAVGGARPRGPNGQKSTSATSLLTAEHERATGPSGCHRRALRAGSAAAKLDARVERGETAAE